MSIFSTKNMNVRPDLLNMVLGYWLYASPFLLLHFEEMTSSLNAYIVGAAIAILAYVVRFEYNFWGEALIGAIAIWLISSPWILGFSSLTEYGTYNAVATGLAVLAFAVWSALIHQSAPAPVPEIA